jgi:acetyl esterase/lipase
MLFKKLFIRSLLPIGILCLGACQKTETVPEYARTARTESLALEDRSSACVPKVINNGIGAKRYAYGPDDRQILDLYLPSGTATTLPKVVFLVHGGGWVSGPKPAVWNTFFEQQDFQLITRLRREGYACAVVKYQLAKYSHGNAAQFMANVNSLNNQLDDIHSAIKYVTDNAACLKVSALQYALLGESAGGHLALQYAYTKSDPTALKTVISFYAPTNLAAMGQWFKDKSCGFTLLQTSNNFQRIGYQYWLPVIQNNNIVTNTYSFNNYVNLVNWMDMYHLTQTLGGESIASPSNSVNLKGKSPAYSINKQRNIPTFILHGMSDQLIPLEAGAQLLPTVLNTYGGLCNNTLPGGCGTNKRHHFKTYNNCGHGWVNQTRSQSGSCSFLSQAATCSRSEIINDVATWLKIRL